MALNAAHKGYLYQDLVTAYIFLNAMIFHQQSITVDKKEHPSDRFDDITIDAGPKIVKYQFKYINDPTKRLERYDLTSDRKDLRIDLLVESYLNTNNSVEEFRLCSTWLDPNDDLKACLVSVDDKDPTFEKNPTKLYSLNPDIIWPKDSVPIWRCLRNNQNITRENFIGFCSRFIIELECPPASHDLTQPGSLESLLFELLEQGVGIGKYPNQHRNVIDVAASLINLATRARAATESLSISDIEKSLDLRTDFGHVSQKFPIDKSLFIDRESFYSQIVNEVKNKNILVLTGEPGSGKSWIIDRVGEILAQSEYVVAKHYCYLEPGDPAVQSRITSNVLFANLIYEVLEAIPELQKIHRPIYSSGPRELEQLLKHAVKLKDFKGLCLMVDGLDHITRVLSEASNLSIDDTNIIDNLCSLQIPEEICLVLSSQPGQHLNVFQNSATIISVPSWNLSEVQNLVNRTGCIKRLKESGFNEIVKDFIVALFERSEGNPLYVTFLCKQLISYLSTKTIINPLVWLEGLPKLEGDISVYYDYLLRNADPSSEIIAECLGLIDFGLTEEELQEIFPQFAHRIHLWLEQLSPIIKQVTTQGGVRIYHESFRRFIVERIKEMGASIPHVVMPIIDWLNNRGFYDDAKAYRFLLSCLRRAGKEEEILNLVDRYFLSKSIAGGHPRKAVVSNLNIAVDVARRSLNWAVLVRLNEIYRAMETCYEEKIHDLTDYSTTYASLFGERALGDRLLFDGKPTYSAKEGLLLCLICEKAGVTAPWQEYLKLYKEEMSVKETKREDNDLDVSIAKFLGTLVTVGIEKIETSFKEWLRHSENPNFYYLNSLFEIILDFDGELILESIFNDDSMPESVRNVIGMSLARFLHSQDKPEEVKNIITKLLSMQKFVNASFLYNCSLVGFDISSLKDEFPDINQYDLGLSSDGMSPKEEDVREWVSLIGVLSAVNDDLTEIESKLMGEGWYRAWLRFVINLSRAEREVRLGQAEAAGETVTVALNALAQEENPFLGNPRACDLYQIHSIVHETFHRVLRLFPQQYWKINVKFLVAISKNSTTYLQGSPSGPITPWALAEMLIPYSSDTTINQYIIETIETLGEHVEQAGEFYENLASMDMVLARAYSNANRKEEALQRWNSVSVYLCGYGFHKDVTIFELIDSIPTLGTLDPEFMKELIEKLHPVVDTVVQHTDGRETKHAHNSFYKAIYSIDPIGAVNLLSKSMSLRGGKIDWRLEQALEYVLDASNPNIDPYIVFLLQSTIPLENDVDILKKRLHYIELISVKDRKLGELCFNIVAAQVEGDRPKVDKESLRILENYASKFNYPIPEIDIHSRLAINETSYSSSGFQKKTFKKNTSNYSIFPVDSTPLDIMNGIRVNRKPILAEKIIDDCMLNAFGYRVIDLIEDNKEDLALRLIHYFGEEYDSFDGRHLYELAMGFIRYGYSKAAAVSLTLAYAHTRSHGGWLMLGGAECEVWLETAIRLSPKYAYNTLAVIIANFIKYKGRYNGITRNLCEFFARAGEKGLAFDIWNEAFLVIEQRVPRKEEMVGPFIPYKTTEVPSWTVNQGAIALLISRINHPELKRKTSAVTGYISIIKKYPQDLIGQSLKSVMNVDMPLTTTVLILNALLINEEKPFLISGTIQDELKSLVFVEHYGIRQIAYLLLKRLEVTINLPDIQHRHSISIILPPKREAAILSLDWGNRVDNICDFDPDFRSVVAFEFNKLLDENKIHPSRIKSRHRASKDHVRRHYPATPFLFWETEMFEYVFHRILDGLNQSFGLEYLIPRIQDHAAHWYSRTVRPLIDLPSYRNEGYFIEHIPICKNKYVYNEWVQLAMFEEQLLMESGILGDLIGEARVIAGLVFPGELRKEELIDKIPFGNGNLNYWWDTFINDSIVNSNYCGPLIEMDTVHDYLGFRRVLKLPSNLIRELGLIPAKIPGRFELVDEAGNPAVVFRQWSLSPVDDKIDLETPTLKGCDLIVRPDIFNRIVSLCGNEPVFIKHVNRY